MATKKGAILEDAVSTKDNHCLKEETMVVPETSQNSSKQDETSQNSSNQVETSQNSSKQVETSEKLLKHELQQPPYEAPCVVAGIAMESS